jgi:hypothetical protein
VEQEKNHTYLHTGVGTSVSSNSSVTSLLSVANGLLPIFFISKQTILKLPYTGQTVGKRINIFRKIFDCRLRVKFEDGGSNPVDGGIVFCFHTVHCFMYISLFVFPSACLFFLPVCMSVCLSVCLPACLPACLPVCFSICFSVCYLSVSLSVSLSISISFCISNRTNDNR